MEQHQVIGLICDSTCTNITGIRGRAISRIDQTELPATLVVDTSGRRSQTPRWLASLGFTPPPETIVDPGLGYATRRYKQPKGISVNWSGSTF